jgi:hypothetical protein
LPVFDLIVLKSVKMDPIIALKERWTELEAVEMASPSPIETQEDLPMNPPRKLVWNHHMESVLLTTLWEQAQLGKRADSGFKKEAWVACVAAINEGPNPNIGLSQAKDKAGWVKKVFYPRGTY